MYCMDEKSTTTSTDLTLILPNIYLGSIEAACNTENLKRLGITHVLTLDDRPLQEKFSRDFKYKFVLVYDLPMFDVISIFYECFQFIDDACNKSSAILIHCLLGVSRSATIVLAYLMYKEKRILSEIYEFVKNKRYIRPNNGFIKQLEIFEAMNYVIDKESLVYRAYILDKLAEKIKRGANLSEIYNDMNKNNNNSNNNNQNQIITTQQQSTTTDAQNDDNLIINNNKNSNENNINNSNNNNNFNHNNNNSNNLTISHYKCKKCRYYLFNINNQIKHLKSYEIYDTNDWNSKLNYFKKLNQNNLVNNSNNNNSSNNNECSKEIFIEPVYWLIDKVNELEGKINCPKCDCKIGSYNWYGHKCSCGTWVVPAFHMYETKIDYCNPLVTLPNRQVNQFASSSSSSNSSSCSSNRSSADQQHQIQTQNNNQQDQQQQHDGDRQQQLLDNKLIENKTN